MRKILTIAIAAFLAALAACDDGRLYEEAADPTQNGRVLKATGPFSGVGQWSGGYQLVVAGFADSDYAEITKELSGEAVVLSGIPANVRIVEICAISRLRKRVATFASIDISGYDDSDTIRWEAAGSGGSMHQAIQAKVFDTTCANCHGASGHAAAGLNLTAEHSYKAIVGAPSSVSPGSVIIEPGKPEESLLYRILTSSESASWRYDHSVEVVDPSTLGLIEAWIKNGARP